MEDALTVCTIISKNYLAQARVLAGSLARHHPGARLFVLVTDRIDGRFDPGAEPFTVVTLESLLIPDLPRFCFQYTILELNTATKPYFMGHLFARHGARKLVYLDPDIMVLASLQPVVDLLDEHAILLTPHLLDPIADGMHPTEVDILRAGAYNLGFLALREGPAALKLLDWWKQRLYTGCRSDPDNGLFTDQKWIDLVPGLFEDVHILRDAGYNVAYWNLQSRKVTVRGDEVTVNGEPCRFFHFSGFDPAIPERVSAHQDRLTMNGIGDARLLFERYIERLYQAGYREAIAWPYSWGRYANGDPITPSSRAHYLQLGDGAAAFGDPFAVGAGTFHDHPPAGRETKRAPSLPFGVNLAGYFQSEKGVGEGGRAVIRALEAAGIPYVLNNVVDLRSANRDLGELTFSSENPYAINLVHVNADMVPSFHAARGPDYFRGRKNIGFWNWELSRFPSRWRDCFLPFDEIWTPSRSSQRSLAAASPVPVRCLPYAIEVPAAPAGGGGSFGLPEGSFRFLYAFDYHSFVERKNPMGAIRAFQRAFGKDDPVMLVLKSVHADDQPAAVRAIRAACAGWPNILLYDRVLDRAAMHDLTRQCDAVLSLHRAEGFGFLLAEAMALGKPVVATAYSSNLDYMTAENSLLVRCDEVALERDEGPYERGMVWAEPDLTQTAELMRGLVADRERARQLGERARADVARELSPARIGGLVKTALADLHGRSREAVLPSSLRHMLWDLRTTADLMSVAGPSSRPMIGRAVERLRQLAVQLLRPPLARQSVHNDVMNRALALLDERLQAQERELEQLKQRLSAASDPKPRP